MKQVERLKCFKIFHLLACIVKIDFFFESVVSRSKLEIFQNLIARMAFLEELELLFIPFASFDSLKLTCLEDTLLK